MNPLVLDECCDEDGLDLDVEVSPGPGPSTVTQSRLTLCDSMDYSPSGSPALPISWSLLKFMSNESVMLSNHLILCCPLLLLLQFFKKALLKDLLHLEREEGHGS